MPFDLGSVNPWRDEDYWPREDAEIGSDRWIVAEIAAGRSGEEVDRSLKKSALGLGRLHPAKTADRRHAPSRVATTVGRVDHIWLGAGRTS